MKLRADKFAKRYLDWAVKVNIRVRVKVKYLSIDDAKLPYIGTKTSLIYEFLFP